MHRPAITLGAVWLALPALLALVFTWTAVEFPIDFWHRACSGRLMWQTGSIAGNDTLTCTIAGREIVNQNWLAELAFFGLLRLGGFELVQLTTGLCYAAAVAVVTRLIWRRTGDARIAAALGLVTLLLAASNLGVRTQAFSAVLFAIELFALWQWPERWWTILVVAVVELLWTNMHGAFPLGMLLPALFLSGAVWRTWRNRTPAAVLADRAAGCYFVCLLVAAGAMFCNPHPHKTMGYVLGVASKASRRGIEEWLPTAPTSYTGAVFAASLLAVVLILLLGRKRLDPGCVLLILAFAVLGCRAQRMVIWWAMVMPAALAPQVAALCTEGRKSSQNEESRSLFNLVVLALLVAMAAISTPWTRRYNLLLPQAKRLARAQNDPQAAVQFLKSRGYGGRIFNPMEWGGYLSWHLDPQAKVFIDGRIDFFPDDVWEDYVCVGTAAPAWEKTLDSYQIGMVVWNRQFSDRLPAALRQSPHWRNVYRDRLATVFVRDVFVHN